jgi:hypothetical protein
MVVSHCTWHACSLCPASVTAPLLVVRITVARVVHVVAATLCALQQPSAYCISVEGANVANVYVQACVR